MSSYIATHRIMTCSHVKGILQKLHPIQERHCQGRGAIFSSSNWLAKNARAIQSSSVHVLLPSGNTPPLRAVKYPHAISTCVLRVLYGAPFANVVDVICLYLFASTGRLYIVFRFQ